MFHGVCFLRSPFFVPRDAIKRDLEEFERTRELLQSPKLFLKPWKPLPPGDTSSRSHIFVERQNPELDSRYSHKSATAGAISSSSPKRDRLSVSFSFDHDQTPAHGNPVSPFAPPPLSNTSYPDVVTVASLREFAQDSAVLMPVHRRQHLIGTGAPLLPALATPIVSAPPAPSGGGSGGGNRFSEPTVVDGSPESEAVLLLYLAAIVLSTLPQYTRVERSSVQACTRLCDSYSGTARFGE